MGPALLLSISVLAMVEAKGWTYFHLVLGVAFGNRGGGTGVLPFYCAFQEEHGQQPTEHDQQRRCGSFP
jgi:hypothetical protein